MTYLEESGYIGSITVHDKTVTAPCVVCVIYRQGILWSQLIARAPNNPWMKATYKEKDPGSNFKICAQP